MKTDTLQNDLTQKNFISEDLGENIFPNPLQLPDNFFAEKPERILYQNTTCCHGKMPDQTFSFGSPGPYKHLYFDPSKVNVGIVTCGGLCPGLNDVIRSISYSCINSYKTKNVYGFRHGFAGLTRSHESPPMILTSEIVSNIHEQGGTILGSSRGAQSIEEMVDTLVSYDISILFVIGGDGSQHASTKIAAEIKKRNLKISIIGIPKTIDNDIAFVYKTFGFDTAVEHARKAINAAHVEAIGSFNGIGLVKLMGRDAGFIAAHASLASGNVNICLIPEEPFDLEQILKRIQSRLVKRDHLVIVVAEGVGQDILVDEESKRFDESGNPKLKDIGLFLKQKICTYLEKRHIPHTLKYIDPSYMIRSTKANAIDSSFCLQLGMHAVHAGMAGKTNTLIGFWNQHFCLVPIQLSLSDKKRVDINDAMWRAVLEITQG
ncbi:MAG: ATP-dependent 6-phosphofructokinase [Desulfobulbaceae bacterium]|nr:ATP-dependent 6-phosphofructokinase [Desulfobulbaceae bacterium]